jgi:hypothetical protein
VEATADTIVTVRPYVASEPSYFKVSALDEHGNESGFAVLAPEDITDVEPETPPLTFALHQNHPNPFNPSTRIAFSLDADGPVYLRIFDVSGRLVRVLIDRAMKAGNYTEEWDGQDGRGRRVATGVYFFQLQSGSRTLTRKGVLLK